MSPRRAKVLGAIAALVVVAFWLLAEHLRPAPCSGAVFFEFSPPLSSPGRYRIEVESEESRCELDLTLPLEKPPEKSRCPLAVQLETQGPKRADQLTGLAVGASPERVALRVRRGAELLYDVKLEPHYSPYTVERQPGQSFCGARAFAKPECIRGTSECWPFRLGCDGPEDCEKGLVCCVDPEAGASYGPATAAECTSSASCIARLAHVACHDASTCPKDAKCERAPFVRDFRGDVFVCR